MTEDDESTVELRRQKAEEAASTQRLDATPQTQRLPQAAPAPYQAPYQPQQQYAPSTYQAPAGQYGPPPPAYPMQQYAPQPMMPPPPAYNSVVMTGRPPASGVVVAIAWILAVLSFLYLLPWAIAATRNKSNQGAIFLLNFFLGWSFIGWIVSLVMACSAEPQTNVVVVNHAPQYYR
ncbi:superinfection immunity protein [Flexivirga oryzae]|uniref:Superinfection immunity protein n=1 Tax=Flexivirga oryzae TaxID=1794944 RepID=A0A839NG50_9MICO|nr:superinfection immunity protein [Flexivirga oryzae]MBB2894115.1 hypothetical protein [Flexivirga oryzae]